MLESCGRIAVRSNQRQYVSIFIAGRIVHINHRHGVIHNREQRCFGSIGKRIQLSAIHGQGFCGNQFILDHIADVLQTFLPLLSRVGRSNHTVVHGEVVTISGIDKAVHQSLKPAVVILVVESGTSQTHFIGFAVSVEIGRHNRLQKIAVFIQRGGRFLAELLQPRLVIVHLARILIAIGLIVNGNSVNFAIGRGDLLGEVNAGAFHRLVQPIGNAGVVVILRQRDDGAGLCP